MKAPVKTVVNLSRARKDRAQQARRTAADANALRYGLTKGQKTAAAIAEDKARRDLDGHRLE